MCCSNQRFVHFVNVPCHQPNVATSDDKMEFAWGMVPSFSDGGMFVLVRLGLVRVVSKSKATSDELDNAHNSLVMWKHFEGMEDWSGCHCSRFVQALV